MIKIIKIAFATLAIFSGFFLSLTIPAYAADNDAVCGENSHLSQEMQDAIGCTNKTKDQLPSVVTNILNGIIAVSGLAAVVFIIIGGINYMTSAGDSTKVEKAKKTILYACIGLAVCALAFAIVNFVITNVIGQKSASSYTTSKTCTENGYKWDSKTKTCK